MILLKHLTFPDQVSFWYKKRGPIKSKNGWEDVPVFWSYHPQLEPMFQGIIFTIFTFSSLCHYTNDEAVSIITDHYACITMMILLLFADDYWYIGFSDHTIVINLLCMYLVSCALHRHLRLKP